MNTNRRQMKIANQVCFSSKKLKIFISLKIISYFFLHLNRHHSGFLYRKKLWCGKSHQRNQVYSVTVHNSRCRQLNLILVSIQNGPGIIRPRKRKPHMTRLHYSPYLATQKFNVNL